MQGVLNHGLSARNMNTPFKSAPPLLAAFSLGSFASLAAAQPSSGAVITYGPLIAAAAIPTIGGGLLIVLAALLLLTAFRLLKGRPHSGAHLVIAFAAMAALVTGAGGVKLMADAHAAIAAAQMTDPNGGTLSIPSGASQVVNATAVPLQIKNIQYAAGCTGSLPSGSPAGLCSDSTTLAPHSAQACEIEVSCPPPTTCALAWNPDFYVDFSSSNFVDSGNYWSDANCTVNHGNLARRWVFSPSGQANATSICIANMGAGYTAIPSHGPLVFECVS